MLLIVTLVGIVFCIIGIVYHAVCAWESFVTLPRMERENKAKARRDRIFHLVITNDDLEQARYRIVADREWRERAARLQKYADWLEQNNPICRVVEASYRKALNNK